MMARTAATKSKPKAPSLTEATPARRKPRAAPTIITAMSDPKLFEPHFRGESWGTWRTILKAGDGLPMTSEEVASFKAIAGDREPPTRRMREIWIIGGRRGGKDSIVQMIATFAAATFNSPHLLRAGERGLVACMAVDRKQARIMLDYIRAFFEQIPLLRGLVQGEMRAEGFSLSNGIDIEVMANNFRSVRGRPILLGIFDEVAYWRSDNSANPDEEFYTAIKPGLLTLLSAGSRIIGISNPYRKSGLLHDKYKESFGKDDERVLVIKAPSRVLNPTIPKEEIDHEISLDPAKAAAEYMAEFRDDIGGWLPMGVIESAVDTGVTVRSPHQTWTYRAFADPSGGGNDSFTCGIAHDHDGLAVLDCLVEFPPKTNPMTAVAQIANVLREYGLDEVTGDRYAAEYNVQAFAMNGIRYRNSDRSRSEIYSDALPMFTSGRVRLLDNRKLVNQFVALERKTNSMGKDVINHPTGGHDDLCNSAAGAIVTAIAAERRPRLMFG